jgi:hypothetical protein
VSHLRATNGMRLERGALRALVWSMVPGGYPDLVYSVPVTGLRKGVSWEVKVAPLTVPTMNP